ncbi:MAG: glycosyltransferase [Chthoniobacter sp.]
MLQIEPLHLTVTVGRDEDLRARVEEAAARAGRPVEIHGWTQQMPELLMTHHVLIGKAGGATVQECTAAGTPMLMTQVVPGQEEGNAQLLFQNECGALCPTPRGAGRKDRAALCQRGPPGGEGGRKISRGSAGPMRGADRPLSPSPPNRPLVRSRCRK